MAQFRLIITAVDGSVAFNGTALDITLADNLAATVLRLRSAGRPDPDHIIFTPGTNSPLRRCPPE